MLEDGRAKRETRLYSADRTEANRQAIQELVTASAVELAQAAAAIDTVSLADTETVKQRTMLYVRACADTGTIPTFSGLMRSMGLTTRAGEQYRRRNPDSDTGKWLELYSDYCGDVLADAALKNLTNNVFAIFVEKARNNWQDKVTIETEITQSPYAQDALTEEDIIRKYQELPSFEAGGEEEE